MDPGLEQQDRSLMPGVAPPPPPFSNPPSNLQMANIHANSNFAQQQSNSLLGPLPPPPPPLGPPRGGPPPPPAETPQEIAPPIPPNKTIYVNNLNSRIKLEKLKRELRAVFENFGVVRDVIAMSSFWRRGQAWILFADQESADKALNQLQGFPYSGKEMRLQYAHEKSDLFAKEDGTFVERPPGPKKPRAIIEREKKLQGQLQQFQQMMLQHIQNQQNPSSNDPTQQNPAVGLPPMFPQLPGFPFPQMPQGLPPQIASLMMAQLPPNLQATLASSSVQESPISKMQQQPPPLAQPPPRSTPMSSGWDVPQSSPAPSAPYAAFNSGLLPAASQPAAPANGGGGDPRAAIPPPTGASKDAMVAAAAAAAAQAVEAARKRALEAEGRSPGNKMPRVQEGGSRFTSSFNPPNDSVAAAAAAAAAAVAANTLSNSGFSRPMGQAIVSGGTNLPNRTLFIENLPEGCDVKTLEMVFKQYPGCGDIRLVSSHRVAFIDYESVGQSSVAFRYLNNFPIKEGFNLRVSYAKQ